jgi:SRSO17 transposase
MPYELSTAGEGRLAGFLETMGRVLGNKTRRASFATYAVGLLGEGERKSVEPIAARAVGDPDCIEAQRQRLLHFLVDSPWSDAEVRLAAVRHALPHIEKRAPIESWILDDTGLLKQGSHSVGVQRQYTGSAGKVANCQLAVSLSLATRHDHIPVDCQLYLPRSWTDNAARRKEARIPKNVRFRTKPQIALRMVQNALKADLPPGLILADSAYGDASWFRAKLRSLGLNYAMGVSSNLTVWPVGTFGERGERIALNKLAMSLPESVFRRVNWAEGTKKTLSARFAARRVVPCHADGTPPSERETVWLVIEWEDGKDKPSKYYLSSLPSETKRKDLVRRIKQRWRTERVYEDWKGELGFDHYEGRRFSGWHHHVSVALCCFAFVVAERAIAFSLSGGPTADYPEQITARAPLPRLVHHHPARGRASVREPVVAAMPHVSSPAANSSQ